MIAYIVVHLLFSRKKEMQRMIPARRVRPTDRPAHIATADKHDESTTLYMNSFLPSYNGANVQGSSMNPPITSIFTARIQPSWLTKAFLNVENHDTVHL